MRDGVRQRLLEINRDFYRRFAVEFSASRSRPWPGWEKVLDALAAQGRREPTVADLGCGNGRFGRFLLERRAGASYLGVDASPGLLAIARRRLPAAARLVAADLGRPPLASGAAGGTFACVALFGVLHHVPGRDARRRLVRRAAAAVAPGGLLAMSFWRFLDDPRVAERTVPWAPHPALRGPVPAESEVEEGDRLLAWGRANPAVRYCHHASDEEIEELTRASGLAVESRYAADGPARANLYVLQRRLW